MHGSPYRTIVSGVVLSISTLFVTSVVGCSADGSHDGLGSSVRGDGNGLGDTPVREDSVRSPVDNAIAITQFSHLITQLFCGKLATCCATTTPGTFDENKCETDFDSIPNVYGIADNALFAPYVGGGHLSFDAVKAQKCISDIDSLPCGPVSALLARSIRGDCNAAVVGTIPTRSAGCRGSVECASPNHCEPSATGLGTCQPPRASGAACGSKNVVETDLESVAQCGDRVSGIPGYCASSSLSNFGATFRADDKCHPLEARGAGCGQSFECVSGLCDQNTTDPALVAAGFGACSDSIPLATQDTCLFYQAN